MTERQFLETLVKRYLANQATDAELEVFMELLKQGKLDDLIEAYMNREIDSIVKPATSSAPIGLFQSWNQWLKIAASITLFFW